MSANMARQRGRVQLEHSDLCLPMNMAKMEKGGISRAAIDDIQCVIKIPVAEVREEKIGGVAFHGQNTVKVAIAKHLAMLRQHHMDGCLPCQMAPQKIGRQPGDAKEQVHLHQTDTDSQLQSRPHLCLEWHLFMEHHPRHQVAIPGLKFPKSSICWPDMCIHILLNPALKMLLLIQMPRIASTIQVWIQIC